MNGFFIDACIFFAYAYPDDYWNRKCTEFFNNRCDRFTGLRVESEINNRLHKRRQLYKDLAAYLDGDGKPEDFMTSMQMNSNDRRHLERQISILRDKSKVDVLMYIRDKDGMTRKGIWDAFQKIQRPLVAMSFDPPCENIIQTFVQNRSDAQILVDAMVWSEKRSASKFVTLDWTDIIRNRMNIIAALCRYKLIRPIDEFPLAIKHVAEI